VEVEWASYNKDAYTPYLGNLLQTARSLVAMHKPRTDECRSAENYMENIQPLVLDESRFIYHKEDLFTLASMRERRELSLLQGPIERFLQRWNARFIEVRQDSALARTD
jgi:hypothetical protein